MRPREAPPPEPTAALPASPAPTQSGSSPRAGHGAPPGGGGGPGFMYPARRREADARRGRGRRPPRSAKPAALVLTAGLGRAGGAVNRRPGGAHRKAPCRDAPGPAERCRPRSAGDRPRVPPSAKARTRRPQHRFPRAPPAPPEPAGPGHVTTPRPSPPGAPPPRQRAPPGPMPAAAAAAVPAPPPCRPIARRESALLSVTPPPQPMATCGCCHAYPETSSTIERQGRPGRPRCCSLWRVLRGTLGSPVSIVRPGGC